MQFSYTDFERATITLTQFYIMQAVKKLYPDRNPFTLAKDRLSMFHKVCGTDYVRKTFETRMKVDDIKEYWNADVESFRTLARRYYIY